MLVENECLRGLLPHTLPQLIDTTVLAPGNRKPLLLRTIAVIGGHCSVASWGFHAKTSEKTPACCMHERSFLSLFDL